MNEIKRGERKKKKERKVNFSLKWKDMKIIGLLFF